MGKTRRKKKYSCFRLFYDSSVKWAKNKTYHKNKGIKNRTRSGLRGEDYDVDPRRGKRNASEWEL
jgi:hypothetical protein